MNSSEIIGWVLMVIVGIMALIPMIDVALSHRQNERQQEKIEAHSDYMLEVLRLEHRAKNGEVSQDEFRNELIRLRHRYHPEVE